MPSILWSGPVPPAAKHPTTWCCHPRASQLGWCSSAFKHPPFSSKHNNGHYGQTVLFLFHQTRGHFSDLWPHVQLHTVVWLFYGGFGAVASSLLSGLSRYVDKVLVFCGYRYFCTCFLHYLHKVLSCCFGIDLQFSHQSTFISRRQNASPSWAVWQLCRPMVFILVYYCLYRWMWYLQAFGNCSQGWTRNVEVYKVWFL